MPPQNIKTIKNNGFTWINVTKTGLQEISWLKKHTSFHPLHYDDCRAHAQHPKIDVSDEYIFIVLLFPVYNRSLKAIQAEEVDFIITKNALITVHDNKLRKLQDIHKALETDHTVTLPKQKMNASGALYILLKKLLDDCLPMLDHMSEDLNGIEHGLFRGHEKKQMSLFVLTIKRNIVNFRKIMGSHKDIIKKFIAIDSNFFHHTALAPYFTDLIEQTKQIWDIVETQQATINALHEAHSSLQNYEMNDIMKTLTMFSIVIFSMTLLAGLFAVDLTGSMPFIHHPFGFWILLLMEGVVILAFLLFFIHKRWINKK
ncbi:MAG TPA: magnesium transporter CorA family protein [Patescibacteria group bacterium]|nr:magnesium transporter CorA family protein [Patescibacteria group bacterium]